MLVEIHIVPKVLDNLGIDIHLLESILIALSFARIEFYRQHILECRMIQIHAAWNGNADEPRTTLQLEQLVKPMLQRVKTIDDEVVLVGIRANEFLNGMQ